MARQHRVARFHLVLVAGLCGVVATWGPAVPSAEAVFPGANGRIAVTTEAYPGPCGDCSPEGGRAWLLSRRGRPVSLPARTVAFSPSGTRVAYERAIGGSVWIAHADGSRRHVLGGRASSGPTWSPRGGMVAFSNIAGGLVVSSADGETRWRLGISESSSGDFAWSPDGYVLAVVAAGSLSVVGFRGRHQRTIVPADPNVPETRVTGVAWSRSGWLSFLRGGALVIVRPDGAEMRTLATGLPPCCGDGLNSYLDYSWSPDGQRVAFVRQGALWVTQVPDGTPRVLVPRGKMGAAPQWSPDGRLIAFVRGARPAGHRLLTVRASGGEPRTFATFNDRNSGEEFIVDIDWQAQPRP